MIQVATSFYDLQLPFDHKRYPYSEYTMKKIAQSSALVLMALFIYGCKDVHSHSEGGDHDAITTVSLTFVDQADTSKVVTAMWEDIDGIGGANPNRIDTIKLEKARIYNCSVSLMNHSAHPPVDLTQDVASELDYHQFFYEIQNSLGQIVITDADSRGLPVGLKFRLTTTMDSSAVPGSLTMSLYHFDQSSDKTGSNRGNETDIEVALPLQLR